MLDGGLPNWLSERHPIEDLPPVIRDRHMTVRRQNQMIRDVTQVSSASKLGSHEILDARAPGRFAGSEPEPRAGLRGGHIPGSKNVAFPSLLNEDHTLKDPDDLRSVFETAKVDLSKSMITSCGSGVSAAVINLALERIGKTDHALYDGSWAEWGACPTVPVATGEA